jgi:hypothetical protein
MHPLPLLQQLLQERWGKECPNLSFFRACQVITLRELRISGEIDILSTKKARERIKPPLGAEVKAREGAVAPKGAAEDFVGAAILSVAGLVAVLEERCRNSLVNTREHDPIPSISSSLKKLNALQIRGNLGWEVTGALESKLAGSLTHCRDPFLFEVMKEPKNSQY